MGVCVTDAVHSGDPLQKPWLRAVAWACAASTLLAVAVALFAAPAAGWHGFILLAGIGAVAFALMFALIAGESAGRALSPPAAAAPRPLRGAHYAEAAFEHAPDAMLVTDSRGAPKMANAAYRALARTAGSMGASERPPGLDRLLGGAPALGAAVFKLKRAARAGEATAAHLPPVNLDGEVRQFVLEGRPLPQGETLWRLHDGSGGVAPGPAPEPAQEYADDAPVGLFSATPDGTIQWTNRTLRDWLGVEEGARLSVKDFIVQPGLRSLLRRRAGPYRVEATLRARDGIETPAVVVSQWPGDGKLSRSVVYGFTAAGAPQAVSQAIGGESEAGRSFDDMFASAPFGVARLDREDPDQALIEDANQTLVSLSEGKAQPGIRFADLFRRDAGAPDLAGQDGEPAEAQLDGDPAREVHVYVWRDRRGRAVAYVVDVSRWKELERQLVQSQKMQAIGQLAGGVAHDFNNLLTAIRGNCDLLLERHPVGDPAYPELQQINSTVARAAGLVRKLLAFSRKQTFRAELLDVTDVISDFSVLLRQVLEETVKVEIVHGRGLPTIRADKGQLETALMNLATNARDAMRNQGGGVLTIRTAAAGPEDFPADDAPDVDGDFLLIEVSDTGAGMPADVRAKVFEPFFTTKEPGKGTGLGLATVYGIVKQSGGYLFVDSEPGKGSVFRIYLPAAEAQAQERQALEEQVARRATPKAPASLSGRGRILLVEDEDAVRQIAAKTLSKRGYEVLEASDGEVALEIAQEYSGQIDLMISDVVMPGLDGPGLLKAAREHLGDARVIFISGYAQEEFSDVLAEHKEVSFLPKPFTLPQLAERVKDALG